MTQVKLFVLPFIYYSKQNSSYLLEESEYESAACFAVCNCGSHRGCRTRPGWRRRSGRPDWRGSRHGTRRYQCRRTCRRCGRPCGREQPVLSSGLSWRLVLAPPSSYLPPLVARRFFRRKLSHSRLTEFLAPLLRQKDCEQTPIAHEKNLERGRFPEPGLGL